MRVCDIASCGEQLPENSQSTMCALCRNNLARWRKRRPAQVLTRRAQLTKWSDRMDTLLDHKVHIIRRKHA